MGIFGGVTRPNPGDLYYQASQGYGPLSAGGGVGGGTIDTEAEWQRMLQLHQQQQMPGLMAGASGLLGGVMSGAIAPWSPARIAAAKGEATSAAEAARKREAAQLHSGYAASGLGRGGGLTSGLMSAQRRASTAMQAARQAVNEAAARENFQARMTGASQVPGIVGANVGMYQPEIESRGRRGEHIETPNAAFGGRGMPAGSGYTYKSTPQQSYGIFGMTVRERPSSGGYKKSMTDSKTRARIARRKRGDIVDRMAAEGGYF